MKRFVAFVSFLLLPLLSFSADEGDVNYGGLEVTWINGYTVQISGGTLGPGGGAPQVTVITNFFGTCTNCVNISPEELSFFKFQAIDELSSMKDSDMSILEEAQKIQVMCHDAISEISHYVRYNVTSSTSATIYTNYFNEIIRQDPSNLSYVHGNQGDLTYKYYNQLVSTGAGSLNVNKRNSIVYSNGIYDFANNVDAPTYSQIRARAANIETSAQSRVGTIDSLIALVEGLSTDPCECAGGSCSPGGGGGSGGSSYDCPCKEQIAALGDYVSHIDNDMHLQYQDLVEMKTHLGSVDSRLKSYADSMTDVFLNDGTIFVDDGINSWSNVYANGYSELYGYNKSNILQRIELLLYGLAFASSSSTNAEIDISAIEDSNERIDSAFGDSLSTIDEVSEDYQSHVSSVGSALRDLWSNLNFLGAGHLQNFSLMEPARVFDYYDLEFEFTRAADFSDLRTIVRTSFQVFYLLGSLSFIIVFWLKVVNFIYEKTLFVLDFFNKVLT